MKLAFLAVIFPGVEKYLSDFFQSLQKQSYKGFDLFIFNDGVPNFELDFKSEITGLNSIIVDVKGSPVKNREIAINHILDTRSRDNKPYDAILFGDTDDYFSENRIETSVKYLSKADIILNDLLIFDDKTVFNGKETAEELGHFSPKFENGQSIRFDDIRYGNAFGLSNTGVRTNVLHKLRFPEGLVALDWYFFACLLSEGCSAVFTNECCTYYRQHDSNTIGMKGMTEQGLLEEIRVKMLHYEALTDTEATDAEIEALYSKASSLYENLKTDKALLHSYWEKLTSTNNNSPLWWENAVLAEI